jgi:hypothetical protein
VSDNKHLEIAERLASLMHERYETAAKHYGWETQVRTKVSFDALPEANKQTMLATAGAVVDFFGPLIEAAERAKGFLQVAALTPADPPKPAGDFMYYAVQLDEALKRLLDGDGQRRQ